MTVLVSAGAAGSIAAAATLGIAALAWLEWRRPDRRHRLGRVAASVVAIGVLAALGLRLAWRVGKTPAVEKVEAALWTPPGGGADATALSRVPENRRFTLPFVKGELPSGAVPVPDAAFVRRRFPEIETLHVFGDGMESWDLEEWRGRRLSFHPTPTSHGRAAIRFITCARVVRLGESLSVQGRVENLRVGETRVLTLLGPDGTPEATIPLQSNEPDGTAAFTLTGTPTHAFGRFNWRLRLGEKEDGEEETLGVMVAAPDVPRTLILESAPGFDSAPLRRWLADAGGAVLTRTRVGQGRERFAHANGAPAEFHAVDARLLAGFDVVLVDTGALAALSPEERGALRNAARDQGLGVLLLLRGNAPTPESLPEPDATFFFPWHLAGTPGAAENDTRPVRPAWPGAARPAADVLAEPFSLDQPETVPGSRSLVHDGQGRTLAAIASRGRGQVGLTLVRETRRWQQGGEPGVFAAFWSFLLGETARRETSTGSWGLAAGAESGPVFVRTPVELRWSGPAGETPAPAIVESGAGDETPVWVPLTQDPVEPGRWSGTFWPRRSGWHRLRTAAGGGGPTLDFYVHGENDWLPLRSARRRSATARFATSPLPVISPAVSNEESLGTTTRPVTSGGMCAAFLAAVGYLWAERRGMLARGPR